MTAHLVDDLRGWIVLLLLGRKPFALVKNKNLLGGSSFPFLGLGNGRDELGPTTVLDYLLGRLPLRVQFPMPLRAIVGGVQDRVLEEGVGHVYILFPGGRVVRSFTPPMQGPLAGS